MENTIGQRILYYSMTFVVLIGWVVSPLVTGPVAAGLQATLQCGGYSAQWQSARHGVDSASQQWPGQLGQLGRQSVRPKMDKHLTSRSIFEDLLVFFPLHVWFWNTELSALVSLWLKSLVAALWLWLRMRQPGWSCGCEHRWGHRQEADDPRCHYPGQLRTRP